MTHNFENQTLNFASQNEKSKIKFLIEPTALTSCLPDTGLRQFSEFPAPKNKCPENSAYWRQLADKLKTNQPREQRKSINHWFYVIKHNARLRGWQRITPNSHTTTITTAAQWDWKRHALTVPLEAFVSFVACCLTMISKHFCLKAILRRSITQTHVQRQKLWSWLPKLKTI